MAKYTVTHACGCTHEYQLFGKIDERERKLAWLAERDCPECRAKAAIIRAESGDIPLKVRPAAKISMDGVTFIAKIVGDTYDFRSVLKARGYAWDGEAWTRRVASVRWGDAIPADMLTAIDGMQLDCSALGALKVAIQYSQPDIATELCKARKADVVATINSAKKRE